MMYNRLKPGLEISPAEPLWKRVPTRDENGGLLTDFMMLIPGLNRKSTSALQRAIRDIELALGSYGKTVCFVDLNLRLNVLWVSVRPTPGICLELAAAIKLRVPEAMLVAHKTQDCPSAAPTSMWRRLLRGWLDTEV